MGIRYALNPLRPQLLALLGIVGTSPVVSNLIIDTKKKQPQPASAQTVQPLALGDVPADKGVIDVN
jgi:hypothetical protein